LEGAAPVHQDRAPAELGGRPVGNVPRAPHAAMRRARGRSAEPPARVSVELERWLGGSGGKTLQSLADLFGEKSFAILFVLLLGVPALPLPTGGVTHVFEIVATLLAVQLIAGRNHIWVPHRWRNLELAGDKRQRFITALLKAIRFLERFSRPRLRF